jgi:resuscitation-promoting factor RpfB
MAGGTSKGAAAGVAALGVLLIWSGIKGKKVTEAFRDLIAGKSPKLASNISITGSNAIAEEGTGSLAGDATSAAGGDTGAGSAIAAKNQAIAAPMAALYGWAPGTSNWTSLLKLWNQESGWNNHAENPSSGAYGIAQALGHGPTNQYPAGPANPPISSATAQIAWGLQYIKSTYGNPNAAWAHEEANGWY